MKKEKKQKNPKDAKRRIPLVSLLLFSFLAGVAFFLFSKKLLLSSIIFVGLFILLNGYIFVSEKLRKSQEIKKMESAFPDFIELMSSNLRAGMTIDRALLLSSRKEFAPLDREITKLGKDIITGKEISVSLREMSDRINSEKIKKTITLIISGLTSGGNLSVLLEETAMNMRERIFVEKRASSSVLMYVIFIFFAVALGAPVLFGLSSVLVGILSSLLSSLPTEQVNVNLPFTLTSINISVSFIVYFSVIFIIVIDILASLVLGLVSNGEEKSGAKYILPLIAISLTAFFLSRIILTNYFSEFFG
ncbi:type II secretion system F family protein [Candidatus Pacearchaeota archaeon]|nr:type II secretion system F family protein [Candidatus Pacearchaeota archaeon]